MAVSALFYPRRIQVPHATIEVMTLAFFFPNLLNFPLTEISSVLARSFEGYFVPLPDDPQALAARFRAEQIDLAASFFAVPDAGEKVGLCLVARRGSVSRIAAMGILPQWRGQGVGEALMHHALAQARERGDSRAVLEVIEQNTPAVRLYEKCGFVKQRRLVGFERGDMQGVPHASESLQTVSLPEFAAHLPAEAWAAPWQLQPATLAGLAAPAQAFCIGEASGVVTVLPAVIVLRALYVHAAQRRNGAGRRFLQTLAAQFPERRFSVPALWPAGWADEFLHAQGFGPAQLSQWEMGCALK